MALRQIRVIGDPILNKKAKEVKEVTPKIKEVIVDMIDTMRQEQGVGLAAPQVGILKRVVVIEIEENSPIVLINPVIVEQDGEQIGYEGCLSVPGKTGIVARPEHVKVKAMDENMQEFELEGTDLLARAICHECAHLDGELYVELVAEGELFDNEELQKLEEEEM